MAVWRFGEEPLAQTVEAADLLRRAVGLLQAAEAEHPAVDRLVDDLRRLEADLGPVVPADLRPRVGPGAGGDGRVYLDHGRAVGAFNPCFPTYDLAVDGARATGTVTFPLAYEGPAGCVHGGFLALLADAVVQHHNCELGVAGMTTALALRYHRLAPLLRPLDLTVDRAVVTDAVEGDRIRATVRIADGDRLCCEADVEAVAGDRDAMPPVDTRRATLRPSDGSENI